MAIRLGYRMMSGWRLPLSVFLLRDNFFFISKQKSHGMAFLGA